MWRQICPVNQCRSVSCPLYMYSNSPQLKIDCVVNMSRFCCTNVLYFLCLVGIGLGQKMPRFSFDTLPVAYHGSNTSAPIGMYNPESLEVLAKFAVVTLEKYQGVNGFPTDWDTCQNGTDVSQCGCCVEDNIVAVAKEIKDIDPTTMVMGYWHSNKEYPIYRGGQELCEIPEWWCRKEDGTIPGVLFTIHFEVTCVSQIAAKFIIYHKIYSIT